MDFPYGEWIILFITMAAWLEKHASRRFFMRLSLLWGLGKSLEMLQAPTGVWHWHYARLAVMLYLAVYAWQRAEKKIWPLTLTCAALIFETLFLVNDPGVLPHAPWLFAAALAVLAWSAAKSYWGTMLAMVGSVLLDQGVERFVYDGVLRPVDLPDNFIWNFGVFFFISWGLLRLSFAKEDEDGAPAVELLVSAPETAALASKNDELK